ncbi:MAG TPA: hypothetical protein VNV82_13760 [Bryobacteraceae bacterium]|jgi:hypothetical protein|nr:hypothetical protein [Bryobacteraceae bacterium]
MARPFAIPVRLFCAFLAVELLLCAEDAASVRKEIETTYDRTLRAQRAAKTAEDLDANERTIDTPDWLSIVNDGAPQHWIDLRAGVIATLGHPDEVAIRVVKFTLAGDHATVIARVGAPKDVSDDADRSRYALIRDTWIKTNLGWRRKMHEKPAPGNLDAQLK